MKVSDELLEAIRSLHSSFQVERRDSQRLELAFSRVAIGGTEGPLILSFASPQAAWAMEWDASSSKWFTRPDLSSPTSGLVVEAFVKRAGDNYVLSFSDHGTPLVRWGFTASAIAVKT